MRFRRTNSAGFSLLELMLAMSMAAMLAMSLYMSMSISMRARQSASATVEPAQAAAIAADLVRQDFESALPPTGDLAGPFLGLHQQNGNADADIVEFCCLGRDTVWDYGPFSEGIRRVQLALRTDLTPPVLVRRVTRNLLAMVQVQPEEEVLCRGVRSFSLRYYDGAFWEENWDSTTMGDVLPKAIEITIEVENPPDRALAEATSTVVRIIPLACARPVEQSDTQQGTIQ